MKIDRVIPYDLPFVHEDGNAFVVVPGNDGEELMLSWRAVASLAASLPGVLANLARLEGQER